MAKREIDAVHNDDLKEFLKSIDEYDRVVNGETRCHFCGKVITLDNIQTIFAKNDSVEYCCDSPLCFLKYQSQSGDEHNE